VEQEESEEQQWQHEVQIVEEQRTLERRLSSPPSVTPSPVSARASVPNRVSPPSPLHVQLQIFDEEKEEEKIESDAKHCLEAAAEAESSALLSPTAKPAVVKMRSFSMSMPVLRNDIDDIGGRKVMGHVQTALRESPQESMNSWEAENEPLLAFFYSQLNPSKVRDVSQVLRIFRDNNEGLNVSLRKTYGIDLTASPEEIRQQAGTRAQDSPGPCMLWLSAPSSGFSVSNTELFTQEQTEESRLL
jgi:hypothetical protein